MQACDRGAWPPVSHRCDYSTHDTAEGTLRPEISKRDLKAGGCARWGRGGIYE